MKWSPLCTNVLIINYQNSFEQVFHHNYEIHENRETRQSSLLLVERCHATVTRRLPLHKFPTILNEWIPRVTVNTSRIKMKRIFKHSLTSKYAKIIKCNNPFCADCIK